MPRSSTGSPSRSTTTSSVDFALDLAGAMFGTERTLRMPNPVMGAEDFSYVLHQVPGAMVFLGRDPDRPRPSHRTAPNHSPHVYFDESAMATGIATYAGIALERLAD